MSSRLRVRARAAGEARSKVTRGEWAGIRHRARPPFKAHDPNKGSSCKTTMLRRQQPARSVVPVVHLLSDSRQTRQEGKLHGLLPATTNRTGCCPISVHETWPHPLLFSTSPEGSSANGHTHTLALTLAPAVQRWRLLGSRTSRVPEAERINNASSVKFHQGSA